MKKSVQEKIQHASQCVLDLIENYELGEIITKITFKRLATDKPIDTWSMFNQISCLSSYLAIHEESKVDQAIHQMDFRGFKQWKSVGRHVLKGQHAIGMILTPRFKKEEDKGTGKESQKLIGFMAVPVFEYTQTEGEPLETQNDSRNDIIRAFNFMDVADKMGVNVIAKPGNNRYFGAFNHTHNVIELCTPDELTFYHELAHAVDNHVMHERYGKGLKGGQHVDQEIVAQFSANVLAYMTGRKIEHTTAYTKQYLEGYIEGDLTKGVMELIHRIETVVGFIIENNETSVIEPSTEPVAA